MLFDKIVGHETEVNNLKKTVKNGKVSHAQLFSGPEGAGILQVAFAYAQYVLCYGKEEKCKEKIKNLNYPDLHFVYPVNTNTSIKSKPTSIDFMGEWREFISEEKFPTIQKWYEKIGIEKKAGRIGVDEAKEINKVMALKSYSGDFKVMIIWMPELMNTQTSNKLLKLIEEPTGKTLFILVTENEQSIIQTILSRTQIIYFKRISDALISNYLESEYKLDREKALDIATQSEGNMNKAISLISDDKNNSIFQEMFVNWVRGAFKADLKMLVNWANELTLQGKQLQINFLKYSIRVFRQALLENYNSQGLSFLKMDIGNFKFDNFVPFIHGQNISDILTEVDSAIFHLERNGNPKIVLLDLSIKITRSLHTKYKEKI